MHVNLLKDNVKKRVTTYPWIPTKHMKGDLFNKAHGPARHRELCKQNGIHYEEIDYIDEKAELLKVEGWPETVAEQKRLEAEKRAEAKG
jgi:hypothetical protein